MAYTVGNFDSQHLYLQWGGKLPGGETWSCGLRLRKKTGGAIDDGTGLLVGAAAACVAYHQRPATKINENAKLSFVKLNSIGVNGRYISSSGTVEATYADRAGGVADLPRHPNQIALAVSLTTGFSRGPAHRGRFYLPLPSVGVGVDGLIDATEAAGIGTSSDTFIADLNAVNADYEVAVFSRKSGAAGNRKVTGVDIGRALDTQRRRRRSLAEKYV